MSEREQALTLLRQLVDQSLDRDLKRQEVIQVRQAITQHLVPLLEHPQRIFILGSYDEGEKEHVKAVQSVLQDYYRMNGYSKARVYLMEDIPGQDIWINVDIKFRLFADISDYIVGVAEHDSGGFVFQQGILASCEEYRNKTLLLKRNYPNREREHEEFSAMQSVGLFQQLENQGQLFEWEDLGELLETTTEVYDIIDDN